MKPALARHNLFLMAARGQAPGEQAMYLTGTMATLPEPTRLLMEVPDLPLPLFVALVGLEECRAPDLLLGHPPTRLLMETLVLLYSYCTC